MGSSNSNGKEQSEQVIHNVFLVKALLRLVYWSGKCTSNGWNGEKERRVGQSFQCNQDLVGNEGCACQCGYIYTSLCYLPSPSSFWHIKIVCSSCFLRRLDNTLYGETWGFNGSKVEAINQGAHEMTSSLITSFPADREMKEGLFKL